MLPLQSAQAALGPFSQAYLNEYEAYNAAVEANLALMNKDLGARNVKQAFDVIEAAMRAGGSSDEEVAGAKIEYDEFVLDLQERIKQIEDHIGVMDSSLAVIKRGAGKGTLLDLVVDGMILGSMTIQHQLYFDGDNLIANQFSAVSLNERIELNFKVFVNTGLLGSALTFEDLFPNLSVGILDFMELYEFFEI